MQRFIDETNRRRKIQVEHNKRHGIKPETIYKTVDEVLISTSAADERAPQIIREKRKIQYSSALERETIIEQLEKEMNDASKNLAFERAADLRDDIERLKKE